MANDKGTADGIPAELDKGALDILEARSRIAKLALEQEKLQLEQQALTRSLSRQGWLMEWLKAGAVPVTLLGATLAFYVGFGQLQQTEENRVSDRFDKALTRLASDKQNERISGILQLRLFLKDEDPSRQTAAMQSLVNAASVETNTLIQASILDTFGDLQSQKLSQTALDEGLRIALQRNRSLTASIVKNSAMRIDKEIRKRILALNGSPYTPEELPQIPANLISNLSLAQLSSVLGAKHQRFVYLPPDEDVPLQGLTQIISSLVNNGAGKTYKDFSSIFCLRCDFSNASHLAGARFDGALIGGANFSKVDLRGASFVDADIAGAYFFRANLAGADLSQRREVPYGSFLDVQVGTFPFLECAKLQGAILSGRVLGTLSRWVSGNLESIRISRMLSAEIDTSTKLETFRLITITDLDDAYMSANPDPWLKGTMESAISTGAWMEYNTQGDDKLTYDPYSRLVRLVRYETVGAQSPPNVLNWPMPLLYTLLQQSNWNALPAASGFIEVLRKNNQAASATGSAEPIQTVDCSKADDPRGFQLSLRTAPAPIVGRLSLYSR